MSRLPDPAFWAGKRVFLTGHTGFKGGWLARWLHVLGAELAGYAHAPHTSPDFFSVAKIAGRLTHNLGDVRDAPALTKNLQDFAPEIVFHLAAQPLVRASYAAPVKTYATNILGTANLLDAARQTGSVRNIIVVTSDKIYAESATGRRRETDPLGGHDPYSASKAGAELVAGSFPLPDQKIATVRGGNVIGGGDWSADRLVPDFFRAVAAGMPLALRNPAAIRPWQHVLEPLCGYLLAAEFLAGQPASFRAAWNFGPDAASEIRTAQLVAKLCAGWGEDARFVVAAQNDAPHEAPVLRLDSAKAGSELGWQPRWTLDQALAATIEWMKFFDAGADMASFTDRQIEAYCRT